MHFSRCVRHCRQRINNNTAVVGVRGYRASKGMYFGRCVGHCRQRMNKRWNDNNGELSAKQTTRTLALCSEPSTLTLCSTPTGHPAGPHEHERRREGHTQRHNKAKRMNISIESLRHVQERAPHTTASRRGGHTLQQAGEGATRHNKQERGPHATTSRRGGHTPQQAGEGATRHNKQERGYSKQGRGSHATTGTTWQANTALPLEVHTPQARGRHTITASQHR
jgi:hypothetical protein